MFKRKFANLVKKIYPRYGLKDDDVILASYPKSGNTWFRFIWLNIVSLKEMDEEEIDFDKINGPLHAEYDSHSYGHCDYESLPRIVKTHKMYCDAFRDTKTIVIIRHPGDVMISYFEYMKAKHKGSGATEDISSFIKSSEYGIKKWCLHVNSWLNKADTIVRYESMKKNTANEVIKVLNKLNLKNKLEDELIKRAVERSSFNNMRKIEDRKGIDVMKGSFKNDYKFIRKGKTGEWRDSLKKSDIDFIRESLRKSNLLSTYEV